LNPQQSSVPKKRNKVLVYHSAQEDLASGRDVLAFGRYDGGYYHHLNGAVDNYLLEIIEAVQELAKASDSTYGSRRMEAALGVMSYPVSRNKAKKPVC
jgi:hypothetical protein